jgi:uncharacterized membrane protein YgaE (UPF0421/DUF939 family)
MNEEKNDSRILAIEIMNNMLQGVITPQQAIDGWPDCKEDKLLEQIYCLLYHYRDDDDIRKKDPYYKKWQKEYFERLLNKLKE